jgi:hypothetical protein
MDLIKNLSDFGFKFRSQAMLMNKGGAHSNDTQEAYGGATPKALMK